MSSPSTIQVINCGSSHLAYASFSSGDGQLRLEAFDREPMAGDFTTEDEWMGAMAETLRELVERAQIKGRVALIAPGHLLLTKFLKVPAIAKSKRDQIVRFEAQQNIPYPLHEVVWDYQVVQDDGGEFEVALAAIKLEIVEQMCGLMAANGLSVNLVSPSSTAQINAFFHQFGETDEPALLLNLGAKSSNLLFLDGTSYHIRNISLAGNNLTQSIAEAKSGSFAEAEAAKIEAFSGSDDEEVSKATEAFVRKLSMEITRSIVNFRRQSGAEKVSRVYLTGGGSLIPGLAEALSEKLKIEAELIDAFAALELGAGVDEDEAVAASHGLTEMIGVAAQSLLVPTCTFNLVPPAILKQLQFNQQKPFYVAAVALVAAGLLVPLWTARQQTADYTQAREQLVRNTVGPMDQSRRAMNLQSAAIEDFTAEIVALADTIEKRNRWIDLLAQLEASLNEVEDVWLDRLSLEIVEPQRPAPRARVRGQDPVEEEVPPPSYVLTVGGRMLDRANPLDQVSAETSRRASDLLDSLARIPYIEEKQQDSYDTSRAGILTFTVNFRLNPDLPL